MNVLIFVMTILMLLSLMTYARLETYRSSQVFETLFEHYMQKMERGYSNKMSELIYDDIHVQKKNSKSNEETTKPAEAPKAPKSKSPDARPRLSLAILLDKTKRGTRSPEWQQTEFLLKELLRTLYAKQPFFKKMEQERPQFLDELIHAIQDASDALPPDKRMHTAADLSNLKLRDEELDILLYKMLHGGPYLDVLEKKEPSKPIFTPIIERSEGEEEKSDLGESVPASTEEFESPQGYFSLLDFITLSPASKIRVYLAPKEILKTIFHDPEVVNRIIIERQDLYRQARAGADTSALENAFKNQFDHSHQAAVDSASLDYSVTKTNPKKYQVEDALIR